MGWIYYLMILYLRFVTTKIISVMKMVYILVFKSEATYASDFFDRKEMYPYEAANINADLSDLIWILQP